MLLEPNKIYFEKRYKENIHIKLKIDQVVYVAYILLDFREREKGL